MIALFSMKNIKIKLLIIYIFIIFFYSFIYDCLKYEHFTGIETFLDSIYLSSGIMATVGSVNIVPVTQTAKLIITSQQILTIIVASILVFS
jgi:hypothetical protein